MPDMSHFWLKYGRHLSCEGVSAGTRRWSRSIVSTLIGRHKHAHEVPSERRRRQTQRHAEEALPQGCAADANRPHSGSCHLPTLPPTPRVALLLAHAASETHRRCCFWRKTQGAALDGGHWWGPADRNCLPAVSGARTCARHGMACRACVYIVCVCVCVCMCVRVCVCVLVYPLLSACNTTPIHARALPHTYTCCAPAWHDFLSASACRVPTAFGPPSRLRLLPGPPFFPSSTPSTHIRIGPIPGLIRNNIKYHAGIVRPVSDRRENRQWCACSMLYSEEN